MYTANNGNGIKKVSAATANVVSGTLPIVKSRARVSTYDDPRVIDTDGKIVFTASGSEGCRVFNATTLELLGTFSISTRYVYSASLLSSTVGVVVFGDELMTLNLVNPASIGIVGRINVSGKVLKIGSRYAYVTNVLSEATMSVISLNDPANPWLVRTIDRMEKACINGTLLYRVIPDGIATVVAHDLTDIELEEPRQFDSIPVNTPEISIVKCSSWTSTAQDMVVQWFDGTLTDHNVKPVLQKQYDVVRFVQTSTKVFEFHNRRLKRSDAESFCSGRSIGGFWGRLASIRSAAENAAVKSFHSERTSTKAYWLSLNDNVKTCNWKWSDNDPYLTNVAANCTSACPAQYYCNFHTPNSNGALHYWYMSADGTWADTSADAIFHPVCEYVVPTCAGNVSFDGIHYTYEPLPRDSKVCRSSAGVCDVEERCDGTILVCPNDFKMATGTICRASSGVCDAAEVCDGLSNTCPANALSPSTTVCRASVGTCDVPEYCTGSSAACPADVLRPSTFQCRPKFGVCDLPENCTGSSAVCPSDGMMPTSTLCRAANGACDEAEYCNGASFDCPADDFKDGTLCRNASDICDAAEYCDGTQASCPTDVLEPPTKLCRIVAGDCDEAEYCSGSAKTCPTNKYKGSAVVCRAAYDICDVAEVCSGSSASCPADGFKANTAICRESGGCL